MGSSTAVDVAIVGGGPGGLSAAAAILRKRPELNVRVFERENQLRRVGNFVGLHANGRSALRAIQPKVVYNHASDYQEMSAGVSWCFGLIEDSVLSQLQ